MALAPAAMDGTSWKWGLIFHVGYFGQPPLVAVVHSPRCCTSIGASGALQQSNGPPVPDLEAGALRPLHVQPASTHNSLQQLQHGAPRLPPACHSPALTQTRAARGRRRSPTPSFHGLELSCLACAPDACPPRPLALTLSVPLPPLA